MFAGSGISTQTRMKALRERVVSIVDATVDEMLSSSPPVDLQAAFLLSGVPPSDVRN